MHAGTRTEFLPQVERRKVRKRTALGLYSVIILDHACHCRFGSVILLACAESIGQKRRQFAGIFTV